MTLFSGVKRTCPLEVFAKNCGQNGPILGQSCALFLANFMTHLAARYDEKCQENFKDPSEFDPMTYQEVLIELVELHSEEDAIHHGRLVEIQEMCMGIAERDNHFIDLNEETNVKFTLNDMRVYQEKTGKDDVEGMTKMRGKYLFYNDWEKLFFEEDASKILELIPKIKNQLLTKKNLFSEPQYYDLLEAHFDLIEKQLKQYEEFDKTYTKKISKRQLIEKERRQMESFKKNKKKEKEQNLKNKLKRGKREERSVRAESKKAQEEQAPPPEENKGDEEGVEGEQDGEGAEENAEPEKPREPTFDEIFEDVKETHGDIQFKVKTQTYYFDYELSTNSRLCEYFTALKKGLRSFFICGKISSVNCFAPSGITVIDQVKEISTILPAYSRIILAGGIDLNAKTRYDMGKKIDMLLTTASNYDDLAYHLAKAMTIARRQTLMNTRELSDQQISAIGAKLVKTLRKQQYSDLQLLGVVDCKFVEAASFSLVHQGKLDYSRSLKVRINFFSLY